MNLASSMLLEMGLYIRKNSKHIKSVENKINVIKQDANSSVSTINDLELEIGLAGKHQIENSLCAYSALEILKTIDNKWNKALTNEIYYRGFKNVFWQGRFEKISDQPLIYIDGCHNIDGVKKVMDFISSLNYSYKRAVISISADKELETMTKMLEEVFDEIIITKYTYMRSSEVDTLDQLITHPNKKIISNVSDALDYTINNPVEFTIFLGSLYLVSEVRNIIKPL